MAEGVLSSRTLALAEPLNTLPRSARSRVSLVARLTRLTRTPPPSLQVEFDGYHRCRASLGDPKSLATFLPGMRGSAPSEGRRPRERVDGRELPSTRVQL